MEWIEFALENPKLNKNVLVKTKNNKYLISSFDGKYWKGSYSFSNSVMFWCELPKYDDTWNDISKFPDINKEVLILTSNDRYAISYKYIVKDVNNKVLGIKWKGSKMFIDSIKYWKYIN